MNQYGARAQRLWQTAMPSRYEELDNPTTYFNSLGEQIAALIESLLTTLEGPDVPGETYTQKVGRLNSARMQAEERAFADLVPIEPEPMIEDLEGESMSEEGRMQLGLLISDLEAQGAPQEEIEALRARLQ